MSKTKFTHIGRVFGIANETRDKQYWTELRKLGKWWITKSDRRFDRVSGNSNYYYDFWRLDIKSFKKKVKGQNV